MNRDGMGAGTPEDQRGLNELLALVAPTIGDVVIGLMRRGKPLSTLGALFERAFDGKVSGGVEDRTELARRVLSDSRFSAAALAMLLENLRNAGPTELPNRLARRPG